MRRVALRLEYDGAAYGGSQRQPTVPSVQGTLEEAIRRVGGLCAGTWFAGRTDAGVHARGQVVAFDTDARHSPDVWQRALNAVLPPDIGVSAATLVRGTFDPRRQAVARTYRYTIWNMPYRSPMMRRSAWWVKEPLARSLMCEALAFLVGVHDVAAFGASPGPGRSTVRRIDRVAVEPVPPIVRVEIVGSAFLPHQVRRTVGALVDVGRGRVAPQQFRWWLDEPVSGAAGPTAPAHGLCLMDVSYPWPLFEAAGGAGWEQQ